MQDEAAFNAFVSARTTALGRTAYLLTGDQQLAEDLLQTALFQAARRWEQIEGRPEAYVRKILYHQHVSWWRRRKLRETRLDHDGHDSPASVPDADLRMTLEQALSQLTTRQRTVLVLRYFEDLTEVQTSEMLGIRVGTVKSTTRDALNRLRSLSPELADLTGTGGHHE